MDIRCLGPLEVAEGGTPVDLGGPQQRHVLAVLVSQVGSTVSTDTIIDDLWGEQPPATARKTIQGYVSSLRRRLPDDMIASTPTGYSLNADPASIDAHRFYAEVDRAAKLNASEARRASEVLTGALSMWRGAPFEGIDDSALLQPEIVRLNELRARAVEDLAAADLFSGREAAAAAELADLTARNPLRERLWALRVLALYRSGRQTEALRVFGDARRTLATEAGLEPSIELRVLEQRILDQDPILNGTHALDLDAPATAAVRRNPYKGLRAFEESDAGDFFGRTSLVRRLVESVTARTSRGLHVVAGPSGSGKSSLVRAGLTPALKSIGLDVAIEFPSRPIAGNVGQDVLIVDQLEEIFALTQEDSDTYLDSLVDLIESPDGPSVIVTVRADVLDHLLVHERFAEHVARALFLVTPLADHEIREIVTAPAAAVGMSVDPDVVASIVADARGEVASLPLIQFALTDLCDRTSGDTMTLDGLTAVGGIGGALSRRADETLAALDSSSSSIARNVFLRLVTITEDGTVFRRRASLETIESLDGGQEIVRAFSDARLLTTDRDREGRRTVELAHESILTAWPLIGSWVDDARSAIRRHRQLAEAAAEWEASGRAEAMLLTGPRLARLSDRTSDDLALSDSESSFLWASEELAARESRAKQRRRRTITAAFGLAAVIAGALAVAAFVSRSNASENAATAQTRALSSAAALATGEDPQLGILLSVQAMLTDPSQEPTIEERLTLRSAMDADRLAATRQLTVPQEYRAMDLSPDGEIMAVRSANSLQLLDTVTWEEIWVFEAANLDGGVAFSPAGDLLAVGSLTAPDAPHVDVFDVAGGNLVATVSFDDAGCVAAVLNQAWSHDGNHLAVQVWQDCAAPSTASVRIVDTLTWTVSHEIPGEWTPQYAENAPRLVLFDASDEPKVVRVLETETYADIGEFEGHTGDISPDGALLASMIGGAAPDLYSVDASLRFDRLGGLDYLPISGATDFFALSPPEGVDAPPLLLVAVGTAGQTTSVWSIESGMTVYELPTGSVNDIAFDHRKQILYTVGQDGFLQVWDLSAGGLAHPEQQTFPFWFDANAMRTNPQSRIGSMFHENQIGLDLYATFDTETGNLLATQVDEIGLTTYAVAPLPGDRFAYVQGDIAVKEEGPIVIADAAGDVTGTLVGCTTHVDDWRFLLERDPVCLSGGTAFVSLEAPETSVEGTELAVALPDGTLHIWDANSLAKTVTEDITSEIGLERMAEFVELPPLAREFATALGSFGPVRQFGAEWVLIEIAPGDGFAVLNRPELDAVAAFGLPVHDWGFETSHDLSFMLLAGEEGLHRVEIGDWEPSLLFESAETIRGLSISPDDARVMIGSTDGLVHIHDANTGELLDQIAEGWVSDGYWLDENRIVVATGVTGTWKILDLDINRVALAAIDQLTRGFTAEECAQFDIDPCPTLDEMRSAVAARS